MSTLPPRNRVIYQSEALFVSPDATGYHVFYHAPQDSVTGGVSEGKAIHSWGHCLISGAGNRNIGGTDTPGIVYLDACAGTGWFHAPGDRAELDSFDLNFHGLMCTGSVKVDPSAVDSVNEVMVPEILSRAGFTGTPAGAGLGLLGDHMDRFGVASSGHKTIHSALEQIKRVQNANYSFTINRQDVNQFGHLARLDSVALEAPTVSLDFSYYLTDGENERLLGFITDHKFQHLSGHMTRAQNEFGNNYFILTVPEGRDAVKGDTLTPEDQKTVISLGNGYITDYSIEGSVGSFPTASVTVDGLNIKTDIGTDWKEIPAIDSTDGTQLCSNCFYLPDSDQGEGTSVLKPGDITIDLAGAGLLSKQISGRTLGYGNEDRGSAHIQSFTLSTPMGRTALQRIGNTYAYAKEVDFPVTCTLSVNALVSDLKEGNVMDLICGETFDMQIRMQNPECVKCDPNAAPDGILIDFKKATLDSESFSSAIGDNKSVDLTFSTQIGGPEEGGVGVFLSGYENVTGIDGKTKHPPNFSNMYYKKYGSAGTVGAPWGSGMGVDGEGRTRVSENTWNRGNFSEQLGEAITGFRPGSPLRDPVEYSST